MTKIYFVRLKGKKLAVKEVNHDFKFGLKCAIICEFSQNAVTP